jgi:hypothetical protein
MQDTKRFKINIRRRGRGCQVRWVPCVKTVKVGKENKGAAKACYLLEALHAGMGTGRGKTKCDSVKGGLK